MTVKLLEGVAKKGAEAAKKAAEDKIKDAPKDTGVKIGQNLWGRMCTWAIPNEKNANRCKALDRLPDIAMDGAKAVGSCATAEIGIGAVPCLYYSAKVGDSTGAMSHQIATGEETKTLQEQGQDYGMEKAKEFGAAVKKRYDQAVDNLANELQNSQLRNIQKMDPEATADDLYKTQNMWDSW